jgi:hypothetical protein
MAPTLSSLLQACVSMYACLSMYVVCLIWRPSCCCCCVGMKGALATRLSGSADLYQVNARKPFHSINFITAHDGFSLADLVVRGGEGSGCLCFGRLLVG